MDEERWQKEWGSSIVFSHGTGKSKGVAILFPSNLDIVVNEKITDKDGRFILLDLDVNNQNLILINVYAPTKDKKVEQTKFINYMQNCLLQFQEKDLILGGDFNMYLNLVDKKGLRQEKLSETSRALNEFIEEFNLMDVWRVINPDDTKFTWRGYTRNGFVQSRIDYFLASTHMVYDLDDVEIKPGFKSDHSIIKISFKLNETQSRGRGFWKFNATLLLDKDYVSKVKQIIAENKNRYPDFENKALYWDVLKCDIRSYSVSYSSWKAKQRRLQLDELHNIVIELEEKLNLGHTVQKEYSHAKNQLEDAFDEKAKGCFIRSRARHVEDNEKSTKYFLQQEIRNYKTKHIKCLKTPDGRTINAAEEILLEEKSFYEKLY